MFVIVYCMTYRFIWKLLWMALSPIDRKAWADFQLPQLSAGTLLLGARLEAPDRRQAPSRRAGTRPFAAAASAALGWTGWAPRTWANPPEEGEAAGAGGGGGSGSTWHCCRPRRREGEPAALRTALGAGALPREGRLRPRELRVVGSAV